MESGASYDDAGAPHSEPEEHADLVPAGLEPQLDNSAARNSTATSDHEADDSRGAVLPHLRESAPPRPVPEDALLGGPGAGRSTVAADNGEASSAARPVATASADVSRAMSEDTSTVAFAAPIGQQTPIPYRSGCTIPRPASLTSYIDEWYLRRGSTTPITAGGGNDTNSEDGVQIGEYVEHQLGVSTTPEQDAAARGPNALQLLASASRSIPVDARVENIDRSGQLKQAGVNKRPRSAEGGNQQGGSGFEPFPPGWHLASAARTTRTDADDEEDEQDVVPADDGDGGEGRPEPVRQRRRTQKPASPSAVGETASSTMQHSIQDHLGWRHHRDAVLRDMHARERAQHFATRPILFPSALSSSARAEQQHASAVIPPSELYYSASLARVSPLVATAPVASGNNSAFSSGATSTATTSTQWFASGSQAEAYYLAHHQRDLYGAPYLAGAASLAAQRSTSDYRETHDPEEAHRSSASSPAYGDVARSPFGMFDSPRSRQLPSSSDYRGGPASYFQQSTPQHPRYGAAYQRALPHPADHAASPSSAVNVTSMSPVSGSCGGWYDSPSADTTMAITALSLSLASGFLRSPEAADDSQTRQSIPVRTSSQSRAESYLASITNPAPQSISYIVGGSDGSAPRGALSMADVASTDRAPKVLPESGASSGSGSAAVTSEARRPAKAARVRKGPVANAYAIDSITGMKPFICKLRWLLQNPQEVGQAVTWSSDGSAVLVKVGGDDTKLKDVLLRTFSHENPAAFIRQFAAYGFTQIRDPEELSEVLDPATQPASIWRAFEDEGGMFYRDHLDDLDALRGIVTRKKGTAAVATSSASSSSVAPIQMQGSLSPLPGHLSPHPNPTPNVADPGVPGPSSFPTGAQQRQVYGSSGGSSTFTPIGEQYVYPQQPQLPPPVAYSDYPRLAPEPLPGATFSPGTHLQSLRVQAPRTGGDEREKGRARLSAHKGESGTGTRASLRDFFRQAATVPRMGGLDSSVAAIEGLLRPVSTATSMLSKNDDDDDDDAAADDEGNDGDAAGEHDGREEVAGRADDGEVEVEVEVESTAGLGGQAF